MGKRILRLLLVTALLAGWMINIDAKQVQVVEAGHNAGQVKISAGSLHTCILNGDGTVSCWGQNNYGQATPPAGTFTQVSAGWGHTCGIKSDGSIACWGNNISGQAAPPPGNFIQVGAGWAHTCGIRSDGTIACWGDNSYHQLDSIPGGTFSQIAVGWLHTCALKSGAQTPVCWGDNGNSQLASVPTTTSFTQISAGNYVTCGVKTAGGGLACWGLSNSLGLTAVPGGTFTQVSSGMDHNCALKSDGSLTCWGNAGENQTTTPPAGVYTQVVSGESFSCALRETGTLSCWGNNLYGEAPRINLPYSLPDGFTGMSYNNELSPSGGTAPYNVTVTSGSVPPGLSMSSDGVLSGTVAESGTYTFTLQVIDSRAEPRLFAQQSFTIHTNTKPVLAPVGNKIVVTGHPLTFTASASDADSGQSLSFALVDAPEGASIDPAGGVFTWTPGETQGLGSYTFYVCVSDDSTPKGIDYENIRVTVSDGRLFLPAMLK